jgi:hypothetical protein
MKSHRVSSAGAWCRVWIGLTFGSKDRFGTGRKISSEGPKVGGARGKSTGSVTPPPWPPPRLARGLTRCVCKKLSPKCLEVKILKTKRLAGMVWDFATARPGPSHASLQIAVAAQGQMSHHEEARRWISETSRPLTLPGQGLTDSEERNSMNLITGDRRKSVGDEVAVAH